MIGLRFNDKDEVEDSFLDFLENNVDDELIDELADGLDNPKNYEKIVKLMKSHEDAHLMKNKSGILIVREGTFAPNEVVALLPPKMFTCLNFHGSSLYIIKNDTNEVIRLCEPREYDREEDKDDYDAFDGIQDEIEKLDWNQVIVVY